MSVLNKSDLLNLLDDEGDNGLFINPLLEKSQVGEFSIDLRLGYDFLVSIVTRQPSIALRGQVSDTTRSIKSYFQETRRDLGSTFVLYPNQIVLATTLEFVSLPSDVFADILSRSSITRLGIHINTMVQPGFRGCVPLELFNHGNNAIELVVGARVCQMRLSRVNASGSYSATPRKYYGDVRPTVSKADKDSDIPVLNKLAPSRPY